MRTVRYGASADQEGDLYLPGEARPPVVCLLHGGFWRMPYARDEMTAIAEDLASHGFAVWNVEYRRVGGRDAEWPATLDDVAAAVDHLATLAEQGVDLDLERVAIVGHSAGGHLALWAASRGRGGRVSRVRPTAAVGLAPIADLAAAHEAGLGRGAAAALIGGAPGEWPERYRAASPAEMLPLGVRQLILHGTDDDVVPIGLSRRYAEAARAAGDDIELVELPGAGHMEFLDPAGEAHAELRAWLLALDGRQR